MQDRYAFDLGDFSKFGLLRALRSVGRIGVIWYLNPHLPAAEARRGDGCHRQHIETSRFDACDAELLAQMRQGWKGVACIGRCVAHLERFAGLADAAFVRTPVPPGGRAAERADWFAQAAEAVATCSVVCCDPDNGVATPDNEHRCSPKHLLLAEAVRLSERGHSLVLYHHFGRVSHAQQAEELAARLAAATRSQVVVFRWRSVSPRAYAIVIHERHRTAMASAIEAFERSPWCGEGHFAVAARAG